MCHKRVRFRHAPNYWHKLRKEALANYSIEKSKVVTSPTILIRRCYIGQDEGNQTDAPSSSKDANGLRKEYRNLADSDILIRMDYASKKN